MSDADTNESLGFDFAPDWARKSAEEYVSRYQGKTYDERTGREARPPREGGFRDRERMGNRREGERSRPPRRDFGEGERRPRRDRDGNRPRREGDAPRMEGDRPRPPRRSDRPFVRREPIKPVEAELRILPNQRNLGIIIRTLQGTHTAYPVKKFVNMFHDVSAYRTYTNPYFKVTVGDCRTKSEAMALLARIKGAFPSAFVVKENINYPIVDKDNAYVVDTVKVLRPKK